MKSILFLWQLWVKITLPVLLNELKSSNKTQGQTCSFVRWCWIKSSQWACRLVLGKQCSLTERPVSRVTLRQRISGNWRGHRTQPNDLILKKKKKVKVLHHHLCCLGLIRKNLGFTSETHCHPPVPPANSAVWHTVSGMSCLIPRLSGDTAPIKSQKTVSKLIWFKTFTNLYLFQCEGYSLKKKN